MSEETLYDAVATPFWVATKRGIERVLVWGVTARGTYPQNPTCCALDPRSYVPQQLVNRAAAGGHCIKYLFRSRSLICALVDAMRSRFSAGSEILCPRSKARFRSFLRIEPFFYKDIRHPSTIECAPTPREPRFCSTNPYLPYRDSADRSRVHRTL